MNTDFDEIEKKAVAFEKMKKEEIQLNQQSLQKMLEEEQEELSKMRLSYKDNLDENPVLSSNQKARQTDRLGMGFVPKRLLFFNWI